ncbi:hypothetical protein [Meridianimarinicoccus sp. MJW13]|uniref:hypothetical protein n=1 Tax=Meridianimarinicoccus sp. MJW13 TaxID=2720031 RepID=UPI001866D3A3|nr:hypothetical protein [Fluviibacterium sp. MJW13]
MAKPRIVGAPQLSRLLNEAPPDQMLGFLRAKQISDLIAADALMYGPDAGGQREHLAKLPIDDLHAIERQAVRIVQVAGTRADALQLRLAESRQFDCLDALSEQPGALMRALWSYHMMPELFVATERAMQVRSFRDNDRVFEGYEVQSPRPLDLDGFDEEAFASEIAARLALAHGCRADAVELPQRAASPRQIMIAVTAAGARASPKTFEPDRSIGMVQYRPANELILVYLPDVGRIEVCGRQWADRKIVATSFAREILGEDLSKRPLRQRSYDLSMFRGKLKVDVPQHLQDRIRSAEVTEVRIALGSYDRKITLTVTPGEDIEALRRDVLGSLQDRHGRGFVCDVELFLRVQVHGGHARNLRFRITNHNSSTLQSQTDPDLRAVGFELLEAWGVVRTTRNVNTEERRELLPILLRLLDHPEDEISGPELTEIKADVAQLTQTGFLGRQQIIETIVIDDEDMGPLDATVLPDLNRRTADLSLHDGDVDRTLALDEVSRWSIRREFVVQTLLDALKDVEISGRAEALEARVQYLGKASLEGAERPIFLASRLSDTRALRTVQDIVRAAPDLSGGIVLVPGAKPLNHLGTHVVVSLDSLLEQGALTRMSLVNAWRARHAGAIAGVEVSFERLGDDKAELFLPERPVWTIIGAKRVRIVERLFQAHRNGEKMVKTRDLLDYSGASQLGAAFGAEWKTHIQGTYITRPCQSHWALAIQVPS